MPLYSPIASFNSIQFNLFSIQIAYIQYMDVLIIINDIKQLNNVKNTSNIHLTKSLKNTAVMSS